MTKKSYKETLQSAETKLDRLVAKARRFAKYEPMSYDESMSIPEISGYSAKGSRLIRRAERIACKYFGY